MPIQTVYPGDMSAGFEGQIADINPSEIISKVAEGNINFGLAVVRGTSDQQGILPSATGDEFIGVSAYTLAAYASADDESKIEDEKIANLLRRGYIWVKTEQAVVPGNPVFFRHTTGTGTVIGAFRKDADTAKADAIVGATFESTAAIGGIALIRIA